MSLTNAHSHMKKDRENSHLQEGLLVLGIQPDPEVLEGPESQEQRGHLRSRLATRLDTLWVASTDDAHRARSFFPTLTTTATHETPVLSEERRGCFSHDSAPRATRHVHMKGVSQGWARKFHRRSALNIS